jgi:ketosteroid isomerase-like protein
MTTKISLTQIFEAIDSKDVDAFLSYLTKDAVFRYGSSEPVQGEGAIRDYVSGFLGSLKGLRHRLLETWEGDGSLVCQGEVTYTRHDGSEVTIPFTNIFRLDNGRIRDYLVYADPTPLTG